MDTNIVNPPRDQAAPDGGPIDKADPWQITLAMRPRDAPQSVADEEDDAMSCDSSSNSLTTGSTLSSGTPSTLSLDNVEFTKYHWTIDDVMPPKCTLEELLSGRYTAPSDELSEDDDDFVFPQLDGGYDSPRDRNLPYPINPYLIEVRPVYDDLVSKRRLSRVQIGTDVLDLAYLEVRLPEGIVSGVWNPSRSTSYLIRRSSDGFFSHMAMLRTAFPTTMREEVYREREHIESISTMKPRYTSDNDFWIHPSVAKQLARDYCLSTYVDALLDPTDIQPAKALRADGTDELLAVPPRYPHEQLKADARATTAPTSPPAGAEKPAPGPGQGWPYAADGEPIFRLFDPQMSQKHLAIPADQLVFANPLSCLRHMQSINPTTWTTFDPDFATLVVTIEGVVYETTAGEQQAAAMVFLHGWSPCNQLLRVPRSRPQTRQQALLDALFQALKMARHLSAADPSLYELRIQTSSAALCAIAGLGLGEGSRMGCDEDAAAARAWLAQTDGVLWGEADRVWEDFHEGRAGPLVDVRMWYVGDEEVRPAAEIAISDLYRADGRDWYAENGRGRDPLGITDTEGSGTCVDSRPAYVAAVENAVWPHIEQTTFVPPMCVVEQGHKAVARWSAETENKHKQALLMLGLTAREMEATAKPPQTSAGLKLTSETYWDHIGKAIIFGRAHAEVGGYLMELTAAHPALLHAAPVEGGQDGKDGSAMDVDVADGDLVQDVVRLVMAEEEPEEEVDQEIHQDVDQMECD